MTVDWVRLVFPAGFAEDVRASMDSILGPGLAGRGRFNVAASIRWGAAGLYFDPLDGSAPSAAAYAVLDLPGSVLALAPWVETWAPLARQIVRLGGRCTRFDAALDLFGSVADGLIARAHDACVRGELCGARRFRYICDRGLFSLCGEGLTCGAR
ncbi:MAG: hypothetical protein KIT68_01930, partial [Phycisphaeraceae bacterium]|nr:hypothetical protein [Phycisphaeraceae bacterium]